MSLRYKLSAVPTSSLFLDNANVSHVLLAREQSEETSLVHRPHLVPFRTEVQEQCVSFCVSVGWKGGRVLLYSKHTIPPFFPSFLPSAALCGLLTIPKSFQSKCKFHEPPTKKTDIRIKAGVLFMCGVVWRLP